MQDRFSKRRGYQPLEIPVSIREDAPRGLRDFILQLVYDFKYEPSFIRSVICRELRVSPDRSNWSEFPNIAGEVEDLILGCEWYRVYDVVEALWDAIGDQNKLEFQEEINKYFSHNGIGWKMDFGRIDVRGDETFETAVSVVTTVLETAKLQTAQSEMREALDDFSRRPNADITGAIQHSLACLECVCREFTGDTKATLGELMKKHPGVVPKPLDSAIEKIWGFTSEQGRHLREGNPPDYLEAELVVELTAALATYLGKKLGGTADRNTSTDDLPF